MRVRRPLSIAAGAAAVAVAVAGGPTAAVGSSAAATAPAVVRISPEAVHAMPVDRTGPPSTATCEQQFKIACYTPLQVRQAYNTPKLYLQGITGAGQTIVIVDSFGSPTIRYDLAKFDKQFGLPAPPHFLIAQPGQVPAYKPTSNREGWAGETDLDVEYAHAMAPGANILLVETPTSENEGTTGFPQIVKAEEWVIKNHFGSVISQSFSATEQTFQSKQSLRNLRGAYVDAAKAGVTVLAASGDSGAADVKFDQTTYYLHPVTSWPDSDPLVTGVGGTQLHRPARFGAPWTSTVWNDTYNMPTNQYIFGNSGPNPLAGGGGKSVIFARPPYQNGVSSVVGSQRGVPDISMSGACNGAVDMYQSFKGQPGWYPTCGTSEATPLFAGVVALADQIAGHPLGLINPALYRMSAAHRWGLVDVVKGNNTVSFIQNGEHTVKGFAARPGYDLASGVGTVNAYYFAYQLAGKEPAATP